MSNYQNLLNEFDPNPTSQTNATTKEPNWMMHILSETDTALTSSSNQSTDEAYKEYCYIEAHQFSLTRGIEAASSQTVRPDGGMTGHNLKVVVAASSISTGINTAFNENKLLKQIDIVRLALYSSKQEIVEHYTFKTCFVSGILVKGDMLVLAFRYSAITRKNTQYDPIEGTAKGSNAAEHNLVHSTSNSETT